MACSPGHGTALTSSPYTALSHCTTHHRSPASTLSGFHLFTHSFTHVPTLGLPFLPMKIHFFKSPLFSSFIAFTTMCNYTLNDGLYNYLSAPLGSRLPADVTSMVTTVNSISAPVPGIWSLSISADCMKAWVKWDVEDSWLDQFLKSLGLWFLLAHNGPAISSLKENSLGWGKSSTVGAVT